MSPIRFVRVRFQRELLRNIPTKKRYDDASERGYQMISKKWFGFGLATVGVLSAGCGGSSGGATDIWSVGLKPSGKATTFAQVATNPVGSTFYVLLDRPGGKIVWPVTLAGVNNDPTGRMILFNIANQPVGEGDSGSLVMDRQGNTIGALAYGFGSSDLFGVTSIEDEQGILTSGAIAKPQKAQSVAQTNDGIAHIIRGVSPHLWSIISKDSRNPLSKTFTLASGPVTNNTHADATFGSYSSTIFMLSSFGDAVSAYSYGTITAPYQGKYLCFGHPLNWEGGNQEIPCVYGSVTKFLAGYKLGFPDYTKPAGTVIADRHYGVLVDPTVTATVIPVDGTVTINGNPSVSFHGKVAKDSIYESSLALTNVAQGVSNIVDASDIAGSATGTAVINFTDGSFQTVDLADSGSTALINDLYNNVANVVYGSSGTSPRLASITFDFTITTP